MTGRLLGGRSLRMTAISRTLRAPVFTLALAASSGQALLGCDAGTGGVAARAERTLASSYPLQAAHIVEATTAFERREGGFARASAARAAARPGGLELALPRRGEETILLSAGGLAVRVREIDVGGEGTLAGSAVAYPRAGGTSLWTATPDGAEEWLLLDAGVARAESVAAAWEIEGAMLRDAAGVIELLDAEGAPRIRVTAPAAWAEGGRPVRATLTAHGHRIELVVDGGGAPVLADPAWSGTGTMLAPRGYHAVSILPGGQILVAGGATQGATLGTTERYDPITNAWSAAAPMLTARMAPIATTLTNGNVLVAGSLGSLVTAAELYDPSANAWSSAGAMLEARGNATATLLGDGRVLYVGGSAATPLASVEAYDPATNTWTAASPITTARSAHIAALLPDARVLIASGFDEHGVIKSVEIYDPAANTWSLAAAMAAGAGYATATMLQNGKLLVVGGAAGPGAALSRAEIYDPATDTWSPTGSLATPRFYHTATLLPTGQVVVAGGMNGQGSLPATEVYDPIAGTWSSGPALTTARNAHSATLLASGFILAAGGMNTLSGYLDSAESYGANGTGAGGLACGSAGDCQSGFCVDSVCCSAACGEGPCDACSIAAGADVDGTCKLFTGPTCNDGNSCTQTDTCQLGACFGGNPLSCPTPDVCHAVGVCSPATGVCTHPPQPDDTPCGSGACSNGVCTPIASTSSSSASSSAGSGGAGGAMATGAGSAVSTSAGSGGAGGAASTSAGAGGTASNAGGAGGRASSATGEAPTSEVNSSDTGRESCSYRAAGDTDDATRGLGLLLALAALVSARARTKRSRTPS